MNQTDTFTEAIFNLTCPYDNEYQGTDKRVLFVCSAGLLRSATAANLYAAKGYNTRSAGSEDYALVPVSANLLAWAQTIVFVNHRNYVSVLENFPDWKPKLEESLVLDIPDRFEYKNKQLIQTLEELLKDVL